MPMLALLLHAVLVAVAAPVLAGVLRRAAARLAGRDGPPVSQPWRDLRRLWRKQPIRPPDDAWLFAIAPGASLACTAAAALLVPSFTLGMATAPLSDLLVLAGLLGLAQLPVQLAAYAGDSLPVQREAVTRLAAWPALLLLLAAAALLAGTTNLDAAAAALREAGPRAASGLGLAALAATLLAGGVPAPSLFAGRDLAVLEAAAALRLVLLLSVLATLFLPFGLAPDGAGPAAWMVGACCWALKLGLLALALAGLRHWRIRLPHARAPDLAALGLALAALALMALFAAGGTA